MYCWMYWWCIVRCDVLTMFCTEQCSYSCVLIPIVYTNTGYYYYNTDAQMHTRGIFSVIATDWSTVNDDIDHRLPSISTPVPLSSPIPVPHLLHCLHVIHTAPPADCMAIIVNFETIIVVRLHWSILYALMIDGSWELLVKLCQSLVDWRLSWNSAYTNIDIWSSYH